MKLMIPPPYPLFRPAGSILDQTSRGGHHFPGLSFLVGTLRRVEAPITHFYGRVKTLLESSVEMGSSPADVQPPR